MSVPEPPGTLYAEFILSTVGSGKIDKIDDTEALVIAMIYTADNNFIVIMTDMWN